MDLRARAARAGVAHGPEVVLQAELVDAVAGHALLGPQLEGLLVPGDAALAVEHGDGQALGVQAERLRDELPAVRDGVRLEVVAEGEVAEHLEERVVPGGEAHVVEVVVLAAGAHALLRGGGARVVALLAAGEDVLELDHAGVGEQQRRVVLGDERRGGDAAVAALLEELEERLADLGGGKSGRHGVGICHKRAPRRSSCWPSRPGAASARRAGHRVGKSARHHSRGSTGCAKVPVQPMRLAARCAPAVAPCLPWRRWMPAWPSSRSSWRRARILVPAPRRRWCWAPPRSPRPSSPCARAWRTRASWSARPPPRGWRR